MSDQIHFRVVGFKQDNTRPCAR